ncbi:uncharacterized protein [Argopecten irradians]|uniref:uncharacterized protein n=1 Tax=Argopecten irradians TaxID=31199 RepID=UPI00371B76F2
MVFKIDKRRVYSGNTLRASNSRYNRQYRRQSCLVRQSQNATNVAGIFQELGLDRDDVVYSFNKKARWLVPQILKHELFVDSKELGGVKVDLVESHKLKKQGKCTGYYSNKGLVQRVLPKKTYFNVASLQGPKTTESTTSTIPHVTMNVLYPCPATSSIAHNPKYIRYENLPTDEVDPDNVDRPQQSSPIKSKARKQRRKIGTKQWIDSYLDEEEYQDDDDEFDGYENDAENDLPVSVSVEDILIHSRKMQDILAGREKTSKSSSARKETKDRVVYMTKEEETEGDYGKKEEKIKTEDVKDGEIQSTNPMECIRASIPAHEVTEESLRRMFGENYSECRCSPRKFVINITETVQSTLVKSKAFRDMNIMSTDLASALVFVYDMFGSLDNNDADMFKIFLNMKTKKMSTRINTFSDGSICGVQDIVNRTVAYIETIPMDELVHRDSILPYSRQARTPFEILAESRGTPCMSHDAINHRATVKNILQNKDKDIDNADLLITLEFESLPPEMCSICCEAIAENAATALQTCGHWFCDRCWTDHLLSVANSGSGRITCPEFKCQSTVDYDILLTTSNIRIVQKVFQRRLTMEVELKANTKWCPNKHCGRAIECKENAVGKQASVACSCGTNICFDCLKPAHWPLACDHFAFYSNTLKNNGEEVEPSENYIRFAQGKECPKCKQFMEKNGGCFFMTCICGCNFCWGCGKAFSNNHIYTAYCRPNKNKNGDLYKTTKRVLREVENSADKSKGYKKALEYRELRGLEHSRIMLPAIHKMTTSLKMLHRRHGNSVGEELTDFTAPNLAVDVPVIDKIKPFLKSMVGVYMEISHICELTTVLLDTPGYQLSKSSRQAVETTTDRLAFIGGEILHVFRSSDNRNRKDNISQLWKLRFQCKKASDNLVRLLK